MRLTDHELTKYYGVYVYETDSEGVKTQLKYFLGPFGSLSVARAQATRTLRELARSGWGTVHSRLQATDTHHFDTMIVETANDVVWVPTYEGQK